MLHLEAIPAFTDNYIWALIEPKTQACWLVDPGEAAPAIEFLQAKSLRLEGILLTHHHADHQGGVSELVAYQNSVGATDTASKSTVKVIGSQADAERLTGVTTWVDAASKLEIFGQPVEVLEVPGHTSGHLAFYMPNLSTPAIFTGDTLFAAGCGRRFEGTAAQMQASLHLLSQLPANTQVYAAHEYTLSNLKFAVQVEPNNKALAQRLANCQEVRAQNKPTLPSSLAEELATNPFLRLQATEVLASLQARHPEADLSQVVTVFDLLRQWKDVA